ncbi:unnamed protein product [Ambrosiozyma monospora]|uniref:Unnamed protein product n=1 Tax=Ambrosiozyma monospora TaxID=43982 RepID=A0ACB5SXG6_AMBMO|nr:unnamed protein product [Ambrosiozyma monospora]
MKFSTVLFLASAALAYDYQPIAYSNASSTTPKCWTTTTEIDTKFVTLTCTETVCKCSELTTTVPESCVPTSPSNPTKPVPSNPVKPTKPAPKQSSYFPTPVPTSPGPECWTTTTEVDSKTVTLTCTETVCKCPELTTTVPSSVVPTTPASTTPVPTKPVPASTWSSVCEVDSKTVTLTCTETVCQHESFSTTVPSSEVPLVTPSTVPGTTPAPETPKASTTVVVSCSEGECSTGPTPEPSVEKSTTIPAPPAATKSVTCEGDSCKTTVIPPAPTTPETPATPASSAPAVTTAEGAANIVSQSVFGVAFAFIMSALFL